jgi:hypothetical protein
MSIAVLPAIVHKRSERASALAMQGVALTIILKSTNAMLLWNQTQIP